MDYRFEGKRKTLSMGAYPAVSLADARARRQAAKVQLVQGIDPYTHKQAVKVASKAESAKRRGSRFPPVISNMQWNNLDGLV
jgi:hypothetical protein